MAYKIQGSDFQDFFVDSASLSDASLEDRQKVLYHTPAGNITFDELESGGGMRIFSGLYGLKEDLEIFGKGDSDLLELQFNLSESPILFRDKNKKERKTAMMSGNLVYLAQEDNQADIFFEKDQLYKTFDIHLPLCFLERYAGESRHLDTLLNHIAGGKSGQLLEEAASINLHTSSVIRDIRNCTFEGLARRIYMESKAFELIAALIAKANAPCEHMHVSKKDAEKIHHTVALIHQNMDAPLTILELSRLAGINQTKLKSQFKQLMGCTIFGYLQQIRMDKAKTYLLETVLSIQEVGYAVGYRNTSNFSTAFKNTYGLSPGEFRKFGPRS